MSAKSDFVLGKVGVTTTEGKGHDPEFWAAQARMLWSAWRDVVYEALPWGKFDGWCHNLMNQIDKRFEDGEFRYNPLKSPGSRRALKEIYKKTVFAQGQPLYDKEKGKPGRKPKAPLHSSEEPEKPDNVLVV